uniref:Mucolipin 2 n=1 Tax=Neogobius melanostomus TaxID=47308 RepID=A0A8C6SB75_9GOBI
MSPCEKYRARRHFPWKMGVQIFKIIMITTQVVSGVVQRGEYYKPQKTILKDYRGVDEDDYSVAVYTQQGVYDSLFYIFDQYSQLGQLSVGPISYAEDGDEKLLPVTVCKESYKRGSIHPSDEAFDIDAQLEKGDLILLTSITQTLLLFRLIDLKITFQLKGINLQTVRSRELPDCYSFFVTITFDNQCHSGKVKIYLDIDSESSACRDWKISGTVQKNTHYLLIFDGFVILVCITSACLCSRSIVLAVKLLQRFSRYVEDNYNRKVCEDDQSEFLNGWYLLVILSDLLTIIGSILKMEIQAKSLTSYDVCSIFLGTATLLVWVGVIRYLGYFQKYNVLILTMKAAFPKVLRFCCCAGMIYLGYTFCGWIVLGPYHEKFEGLSLVAECLFSLVNGDDMFATFAQLKDKNTLVWLFSRVYLYSFISLFIYMVLSLFIALITDSYETIKKYQKDGFPLTDLQKFLREDKGFIEESIEIDVQHQYSVLCCCKRYLQYF